MLTEPSNFTVSSVRPNVSIALSWTPLHWPSGFRPTASRVRSTTWIRKLRAEKHKRMRDLFAHSVWYFSHDQECWMLQTTKESKPRPQEVHGTWVRENFDPQVSPWTKPN